MPKFRKKPVVIDAVQLDDNCQPGWWVGPEVWLIAAVAEGIMCWSGSDYWTIKTLEGDHKAVARDWIIRGTAGELYPCKPDIFATIYEPA